MPSKPRGRVAVAGGCLHAEALKAQDLEGTGAAAAAWLLAPVVTVLSADQPSTAPGNQT